MDKNVLEWAPFVLREATDIEDFYESVEKLQKEMISKQKGFISRELLKSEDLYAELIRWESMEDAKVAAKNIEKSGAFQNYVQYIDLADYKQEFAHFEIIRTYK